MGLFRSNEPVFVKKSTSAEDYLTQLNHLLAQVDDVDRARLERDIKLTEAGIFGEQQVAFELAHSHQQLYVLQDLCFEHKGLTSQIDFLVIAPSVNVIIECKNLVGNIEINNRGDFVREFNYGKYKKKEGIYSPITQNERHLQLMKAIRAADKGKLMRLAVEMFFEETNKSVVVLSNPHTVLKDRYASQKIKQQVIRADALIEHIKQLEKQAESSGRRSTKQMEASAAYWMSKHLERDIDLSDKYKIKEGTPVPVTDAQSIIQCPKCGSAMVRRKAGRGDRAGKEFWGCSTYPKCRGIVNIELEERQLWR